MRASSRSQHPTDALIHEIIVTGRAATADEVAAILERMLEAPFPGLASHVKKRTRANQWTADTRAEEYLADLHHAIARADRVGVYRRRGSNIAVAQAESHLVVPARRRGRRLRHRVAVFYSADRGILLSGYGYAEDDDLITGEIVRWLR